MDFVTKFVQDCELRQLTARTIETYKSDISNFLEHNPDPSVVKQADLKRYLRQLQKNRLADSTLTSRFSAINSFYEWMLYEGYSTYNPVPQFRKRYLPRKVKSESRQLISLEDMRELAYNCTDLRDASIIITLAKTGVRRGELLNMTIDCLDFQHNIIHVPEAAKRTNRTLFMDEELRYVLDEYLCWWERFTKSDWLWITKAGGRIHKDHVGQVLAELGQELDLHRKHGSLDQKLTPHCMRHFFTTHLFRAGMNPEYIRFLRGDSMNTSAWQIYNHIDVEDVRKEYERCIPQLL